MVQGLGVFIRPLPTCIPRMGPKYEVVVAGAGPSGAAAARACADAGLSTLLLEEQAHAGIPVQCAGLLSSSAFHECRVSDRPLLNRVSGAVVTGSEDSFSFDAGKTMAYVVDRSLLDQEMVLHAADAGAETSFKSPVIRVNPSAHQITVAGIGERKEITYDVLIAADGPRASIARMAGLPRAPVCLSGLQCDIPWESDPDKVGIFPNASPEFFGWNIPLGPGRSRVGLCGISGVREKFTRFVSQFTQNRLLFVSGTIPLGTLERTYTEGIMVVGDAAALAKPTSGGGVYTGVRSGRHAAVIAVSAHEEGRYDAGFLSAYQQRWKADFGRELKAGMAAFALRQRIRTQEMDQIIRVMQSPSISDLIVRYGDMDRPGRLLGRLLVHPGMYPAAMIAFRSCIRSLFR